MPSRRSTLHTFARHSRHWDDCGGAIRRQRWDDLFRMTMLLGWLLAAVFMCLTRCAAPVPVP